MRIGHKQQQKAYSCGAACLAMVLSIDEKAARKLAATTRTGTHLHNLMDPIRKAGHNPHYIEITGRRGIPPFFREHVDNLRVQSERWPLILSLAYHFTGIGSTGKLRKSVNYHAVVMYKGEVYDPGETQLFDAEAIEHDADRGLILRSYILIEPKETT